MTATRSTWQGTDPPGERRSITWRLAICLGACCLAASWLRLPVTLSLGLVAAGACCMILGSALALSGRATARAPGPAAASLEEVLATDTVPCLLTGPDLRIRHANPAARVSFSANTGVPLAAVLRDRLPNPTALLARMTARTDDTGVACEDVVTGSGAVRVTSRRAGEGVVLWRFETYAPQPDPADEIGLPTLTIGRKGAVLATNAAARRLFGRRVRSLAELGTEDSLRTGAILTVENDGRARRVEVRRLDAGPGRSEIVLLPAPDDDAVPDALLESLPIALLKVRPDGRIRAANREARALMRLEEGEDVRLGQLLEGLGRPIPAWLGDAAQGRGLNRPEFLRLSRGPEDTFVQVALTRTGPGDIVAVMTDATELKTLEAQFVQSQKMQAIGQLAGGIAHDFNNLLTAISGHCDLLLLRHNRGDQDYDDVVQINQNANRAAALVGQLLAFSRKQAMKTEVLDLRETLSDLTHLLNRLVGERVTLELRHEPALAPIRADRRQLEQVMMNLVVNARDAMPEGGRILVETERMRLREPMRRDRAVVEPGDYVVVKVSDTGSGIAPDKVRKVFEPFYTTKRSGEGTGLGLSTVYGIVKQSGGFVFLDSVPGEGTTFRLMFPAHAGAIPAPPAAEDRAGADRFEGEEAAGGVVLLVEDEAPVRAFATRGLRLKGLTVIEADNGERALELLADPGTRVDLIVSDMIMPGLDGPSWVRRARENRADIPVIFVSGYAADALETSAADMDNVRFLQKPFSLALLVRTVRRVLAQQRTAADAVDVAETGRGRGPAEREAPGLAG